MDTKLKLIDENDLPHLEKLKEIRQKCLDSKHPLRFIQYSNDEKWYMNEYNHILKNKRNKNCN
jgi:hypothetical protein